MQFMDENILRHRCRWVVYLLRGYVVARTLYKFLVVVLNTRLYSAAGAAAATAEYSLVFIATS